MTDHSPSSETPTGARRVSLFAAVPGARLLNDLHIGGKLTIGFGVLVALALMGAGVSYLGGATATDTINRTDDFRAPAALASARAQEDLLRMLSDVHLYLALGDQEYQDRYRKDSRAFQDDLVEMQALSPQFATQDKARLEKLQAAFAEWSPLPDQLFDLRNNPLEREPAYKVMATDGLLLGGTVQIDVNSLIDAQARRVPTAETIAQTTDLARFQSAFAGMLAGIRAYVTTRTEVFRAEYEANLALNQLTWDKLIAQKSSFTPSQQTTLEKVRENRDAFLRLPGPIFDVLASDRWREDLFLFKTKAVPLADTMLQLLDDMTLSQQALLKEDLATGRQGLDQANRLTLAGGLVAVILGLLMAFIFRENIAGPVRRLTRVAEQIGTGDLEARASVESKDEIGTLAGTFNGMTSQLRQTLMQVRKEKKRADDLLDVVIPIGVQLSAQEDFNRLLESVLLEAKSFCHADSGSLLLRTEDNLLKTVILRNDTLKIAVGGTTGREISYAPLPLYDESTGKANEGSVAVEVALQGISHNTPGVYAAAGDRYRDVKLFDQEQGYRHTSLLAIPLKNSRHEVVGVLQLANARDPETGQIVAFDPSLQQMMESLSALAGVALEAYIREQTLRQEIRQLRIEIDESKRQAQVSEIVDTDFFHNLQARARTVRARRKPAPSDSPADQGS